jgi:predicted nucleic acid-binding protein
VSVFVVDASVAAKLFLKGEQEALTGEAIHLFRRHANAEVQLIVPDLFWAELGNVFCKAIRQRRFTKEEAEGSLRDLRSKTLHTISSEGLLDLALTLALTFGRSLYDSLYVALALEANSQLITADERLVNALGLHLPVKWLGAI